MRNLKKKIKTNYNNMMKIDKVYEEQMANIVCYLRAELNGVDAEEAINDVLEILLSAQERNEDLNIVIGDYKKFCNETIKAYKGEDKNYNLKAFFIDYSVMIVFSFVFFIGLDIILQLGLAKASTIDEIINLRYSLSLAPIVNFLVITLASIKIVKWLSLNPEKATLDNKKNILKFTLGYASLIVMMVASTYLFKEVVLYSFVNTPILIIVGILGAILFLTASIINVIKVIRSERRTA